MHAYGVFLRSENIHAGDAFHHGNALPEQGLRVFVHGVERERRRVHGDEQNGALTRVHLLVGRRPGHVRRKLSGGLRDGGLNVLRCRIDVTLQGELNGDGRGALRIGGAHGIDAGYGGKFALQRRGDGRSHGLGIGARQSGHHLDGWVIHGGERGHRKRTEGDGAEQQHGE